MKKVLSFCLLFVAFAFCAKAQVTVILEAHDVWGDGSGYQLLLDADHNTYGSTIPTSGPLTSSGDVDASVYAEFEYKIPENADGALTTSNIVFDGQVEITIPAGTYDFCVTNPTPGAKMWIAGGDNARQDDYVFQDGYIYHFTVAREGDGDAVTIEAFSATEPTISVSESSIDFGAMPVGENRTVEVTVNLYNMTSATATTAAPFSISTDGNNFSTTANIASSGTTLYVKYEANAATTSNGTVTLSGDGATTTVTLTGTGVTCNAITAYPYTCEFDRTSAEVVCWEVVDANGDGSTFGFYDFDEDGNTGIAAYMYNSTNNADDWLISPELSIFGNTTASFSYRVAGSNYPEIISAWIIPAGADYTQAVQVMPAIEITNTEWESENIDLSSYVGQTIRVAFKAESLADQYWLAIDHFEVNGVTSVVENPANTISIYPNPATTVLNVEAEGYSTIEIVNLLGQTVYTANTTSNMQINVSNLNNGVYFVRLNGANGTATQKFIKK